jgi:AcrR family transcriptional regulator
MSIEAARPSRRNRAEKKADTRAAIVAAARRVFERRGFHAASLDEIAEEAGYTKGAVYSSFSGKDDLFLAVLEEHYARRAAGYDDLLLQHEDADATFRAVARFMFDAYRREQAWWPVVADFSTHASRDSETSRRVRETRQRFHEVLARQIEQVGERFDLTFALPAREIARGLGAFMRGMIVEWSLDPSARDGDAFEEMASAFMRGLAQPTRERTRR